MLYIFPHPVTVAAFTGSIITVSWQHSVYCQVSWNFIISNGLIVCIVKSTKIYQLKEMNMCSMMENHGSMYYGYVEGT